MVNYPDTMFKRWSSVPSLSTSSTDIQSSKDAWTSNPNILTRTPLPQTSSKQFTTSDGRKSLSPTSMWRHSHNGSPTNVYCKRESLYTIDE